MRCSANQTKKKFDSYCKNFGSSTSVVKSGLLTEFSTPKKVEQIHDLVLADREVKLCQFVDAKNFSYGNIVTILNDHPGLKKLFAIWMPHLLWFDYKFKGLFGFVEPLSHWVFAAETKIYLGEPASKKAKASFSANRMMATVFLGCTLENSQQLPSKGKNKSEFKKKTIPDNQN